MAGGFLGKTLAAVSLSVALASVTVKSLGGCSVAACRNSLSSCRFHVNSNMMSGFNGTKENSHNKARTSPYPGSKVQRSQVPNDKVDWLVEWHDYNPVEYTAVSVLAGPQWGGSSDQKSCRTDWTGWPGAFGRWGPNHAADPIITRWKRDRSGNKISHPISGRNILQFVGIKGKIVENGQSQGQKCDSQGMVDPGEKISATLKREFGEEALNSLQKSSAEKRELQDKLHKLFSQEHLVIYKGYVDDPRNTDNAWIETEAVNYHDETGEIMDSLTLEAGDDAGKVKWIDISDKLKLYASHAQFIKLVAEKRDAHWSEDNETGCPG